jgi:hypothetical protein
MTDTPTPKTANVTDSVPGNEPETGRFSSVSGFQFLLVTGCVVALGLVGARGLFRALPPAHASTDYRQASATLDDTFHSVRVAMLTGQELPEVDGTTTTISSPSFAGTGGGTGAGTGPFRLLRVESRAEDALVSAVVVAGSFRPVPCAEPTTPDDLPRLTSATVNALLADPSLEVRRIRHDTQLSGETLRGLIVVSPGVELVLRNVVLTGAVVSDAALSQDPLTSFNQDRAPTVIIEGVLRTEPMRRLPGVSIVMPDGIVRTKDDRVSLQLHGTIVAHSVTLRGNGSLFGQIATLSGADIGPSLERIGHGRVPRGWPKCLDMRGSLRTDFIAHLPANTRWADVQPMLGYRIP